MRFHIKITICNSSQFDVTRLHFYISLLKLIKQLDLNLFAGSNSFEQFVLLMLEAEHMFSVTQTLPSEGICFLSVHNYRSLFCLHKDWIYWIYDTTKTKSCHSNLIDVNTSIFQGILSSG